MTATRRIFITGATGGLGRRIVADRLARGDALVVLSRRPDDARRLFAAVANPRLEVVEGDPAIPGRWQRHVGSCEAVVHLAGEPIAARRWNAEVRESIRRSRVEGTYQVAFACTTAAKPPSVLVSASGIGFLPRDAGSPLDEASPAGRDFLAQVAVAWEREALRARSESTRVAALRIPIVLDAERGFLREVVPWWRRGVDPTPWSARDRVPWLHWQDIVEVVDRALRDDRLEGPVHAVAPEASEASSWRRAIAAAVGRGAIRVPPFLARLAAGGVIDSMRGSREAVASKLEAIGFAWRHRDLHEAIAIELRPPTADLRPPRAPSEAARAGASMREADPRLGSVAPPHARRPDAPRPAPAIPSKGRSEATPAPPPMPTAPPPRVTEPPANAVEASASRDRLVPTPSSASPPAEAAPRDPAGPPPRRSSAAAAVVCSAAAVSLDDPREVASLGRLVHAWRAIGIETALAARDGLPAIEAALGGLGAATPLILDLGASLRSGPERRLLRATPLPPAIVSAVLERLAMVAGVRAALHDAEGPVDPRRARNATIIRLDLAGDAAALDDSIAAISEPWWREGAIAVFRLAPQQASIVAGGVDKAVGLQRILRGMGLPPSRAFVLAGGEEDLGLLGLCRGAVVGQASARLAAATNLALPRGDWDEVDAAVRRAFAAVLAEGIPPVHSPPS